MATQDTRQTILDAARAMVQARGYNALSFREIGKIIGIKSASIHHHFPTKGALGAALAHAYTERGKAYLEELSSTPDLAACIDSYVAIFRAALLDNNRMCLCGIMAAEVDDLPDEVRTEVERFTDVNVDWLAELLSKRARKSTQAARRQRAIAIFAAIEGAQLVARGRGDVAVFDAAIAAYRAAGLLP